MSSVDPAELATLLAAASGVTWSLERDEAGLSIAVHWAGGPPGRLSVERDGNVAPEGDWEFVGHARADVDALLSHLRGDRELSPSELAAIDARAKGAAPLPWTPFLESDGGIGGCSVIRVSDAEDQPDLYLRLDGAPAPDADFAFVALARRALPALLDRVVGAEAETQAE